MSGIKPIETIYNNLRFRSRLEARHAVLFDVLDIPYEYEKDTYQVGKFAYLPDFWLSQQDCWLEVKGQIPSKDEYLKAQGLARYSGKRVYISIGEITVPREADYGLPPFVNNNHMFVYFAPSEPGYEYDPGWIYPDDSGYLWCECAVCHRKELTSCGAAKYLTCGHHSKTLQIWDNDGEPLQKVVATSSLDYNYCSDNIVKAYTAARQARFEHGERGIR